LPAANGKGLQELIAGCLASQQYGAKLRQHRIAACVIGMRVGVDQIAKTVPH
jgi:hypothetical protein